MRQDQHVTRGQQHIGVGALLDPVQVDLDAHQLAVLLVPHQGRLARFEGQHWPAGRSDGLQDRQTSTSRHGDWPRSIDQALDVHRIVGPAVNHHDVRFLDAAHPRGPNQVGAVAQVVRHRMVGIPGRYDGDLPPVILGASGREQGLQHAGPVPLQLHHLCSALKP